MKDNFLNHNFDKILLFLLVLVLLGVTVHIAHHDANDMEAVTWSEGSFSTVLGALILILTGRIARSDHQTANGSPDPTLPTEPIAGTPAPKLPIPVAAAIAVPKLE